MTGGAAIRLDAPSTILSLETLLSPVSTGFFFDKHYEREPLLVARACPDHFRGVLTLNDVDQAITTLDIRYPDLSLVCADRHIDRAEYADSDGVIDPAQLYRLHADGATIIINHLHTAHPRCADLCAALELEFSAPFQANIYVTPPGAQGFKAHFDTHDIFVLQLHGSKRWRLFDEPIPLPLAAQEEEIKPDGQRVPQRELEVYQGDTLYIPRGLVHDAVSSDETSVHATVGVLAYTWADVMVEALEAAVLGDPAFRRALPRTFAGASPDSAVENEIFKDLMSRFSAMTDARSALQRFVEQFMDARKPRLYGQLRQLQVLRRLDLNSIVTRRPHVAYALREEGGATFIRCYGKEISVPAHAGEAVRYALATPDFTVSELPSSLEDQGKLVLINRLVREGILMMSNQQSGEGQRETGEMEK